MKWTHFWVQEVLRSNQKQKVWSGQRRKSPSAPQPRCWWSFWAQHLDAGFPGAFFSLNLSPYTLYGGETGFFWKRLHGFEQLMSHLHNSFFLLSLSSSPHPTETVRISNCCRYFWQKESMQQRNGKKGGGTMGLNIPIKTTSVIWVSIFTTNLAQHQ